MTRLTIALIALLSLTGLAACKTDAPDPSELARSLAPDAKAGFLEVAGGASSTHWPSDDVIHHSGYAFSWQEGLDDLDERSEVLGRGVWREPDGDIVTCTRWNGELCIATRESDDSLDMLEDMGLIGAGALAGAATGTAYQKRKLQPSQAFTPPAAKPSLKPRLTPSLKSAPASPAARTSTLRKGSPFAAKGATSKSRLGSPSSAPRKTTTRKVKAAKPRKIGGKYKRK